MRQRALTTEETKPIEEKLEELIVTARGIGDREIDRQLADFICDEFGLPRDRAEATAKAYGDSWMQEALPSARRPFVSGWPIVTLTSTSLRSASLRSW